MILPDMLAKIGLKKRKTGVKFFFVHNEICRKLGCKLRLTNFSFKLLPPSHKTEVDFGFFKVFNFAGNIVVAYATVKFRWRILYTCPRVFMCACVWICICACLYVIVWEQANTLVRLYVYAHFAKIERSFEYMNIVSAI